MWNLILILKTDGDKQLEIQGLSLTCWVVVVPCHCWEWVFPWYNSGHLLDDHHPKTSLFMQVLWQQPQTQLFWDVWELSKTQWGGYSRGSKQAKLNGNHTLPGVETLPFLKGEGESEAAEATYSCPCAQMMTPVTYFCLGTGISYTPSMRKGSRDTLPQISGPMVHEAIKLFIPGKIWTLISQ